MHSTIARMTRDELRALIAETVELKLMELLHDPDEGLELKKEVRDRLRRSFAAEQRGERGITSKELARHLGIKG